VREVFVVGWLKSSYSGGGSEGNRVEVAFAGSGVAVRDSENTGAQSAFPAEAWKRFPRR
jgi:uncharacterized protein DUF397